MPLLARFDDIESGPSPVAPDKLASSPRLIADGVSVHFGRRLALRDVSVGFHGGETVSLVGPNGAGKSTLLKVLAGMLSPSHGRVERRLTPDGRVPTVSYVPQRTGVDWSFPVDVLDVVLMGAPVGGPLARLLPYRHDLRRTALDALEQVGMDGYARTQIGELSGGQQQRVFLARALMQRGDILLLDEPFTGVDVPTQELLLTLLREQCEQGRTVIYATHDLEQSRRAAGRVLLVNGGIIADGPPREVLTPAALRATFGGQVIVLAAPISSGPGETVV
jgi:ABC-type Mn2+/Zn2+ transport system ATPase subunit